MTDDSMDGAILTPAYGRDYKSAKAVEKDFLNGKDFIFNKVSSRYTGKPCSIRDAEAGDRVELRYDKMRKLTTITITQEDLK